MSKAPPRLPARPGASPCASNRPKEIVGGSSSAKPRAARLRTVDRGARQPCLLRPEAHQPLVKLEESLALEAESRRLDGVAVVTAKPARDWHPGPCRPLRQRGNDAT